MIGNIIKSVFSNFQTFLIVWVVIIIVNQLFIFGACFASYCIIAALPHTGVIASLITYFMNEPGKEKTISNEITNHEKNTQTGETRQQQLASLHSLRATIDAVTVRAEAMRKVEEDANTAKPATSNSFSQSKKDDLDLNDIKDTKVPYCPECGSIMILRVAKKGKHSGHKFWGCRKFPNCCGVLNI